MQKYFLYVLGIGLIIFSALLSSCGQGKTKQAQVPQHKADVKVMYYTCGMHPSVRISPKEYKEGQKSCPICNMNLVPVKKRTASPAGIEHKDHLERRVSRNEADGKQSVLRKVDIPVEQLKRVGVQSELVTKRTLCKNIRTVGQIAYDPDLLIAQEELVSVLKSLDEIEEGINPEITDRARKLVESSKRKLRLSGLSTEQIEEIAKTRVVQKGLILPEKKMWVYGDIYEYEISWVHSGSKITVTTESFPGKKFHGEISAIDPVINPKTRSVRFRAQINNPDLKLKPQMYVDVVMQGICINKDGEDKVPAIPKDAVIDTGLRKIIWIDMGDGVFEGREVEIGMEGTSIIDGDGRRFYPVFKGIEEGEKVVTKGNFLIDSQSQITGIAASAYGGALGDEGK